MKKINNIISKEEFQKHKNKLSKEKVESLIERNIEMLAKEKFDEARFSSDRNETYAKAMDAYDLCPNNYQYKTFAISKLLDTKEIEEKYLELINTIDNEILNSKEGLFKFFDENEINAFRYKDLKYRYCCSLILNNKYEKALEELKAFNRKYSYIDFKVKHLILNLSIILDKKDDFLNEYYSIDGKQNILYKLPLLYVLFKNGNYKDAKKELNIIHKINPYLVDIILNIDDKSIKREIDYSKSRYYIASREEALFCLKYFKNLYSENEFRNFISNNKE